MSTNGGAPGSGSTPEPAKRRWVLDLSIAALWLLVTSAAITQYAARLLARVEN